ncbi:hypothetical protein [Corynebacterium cystitidis]|nr:hypothetical protein [Corynebacterium cystitidis]
MKRYPPDSNEQCSNMPRSVTPRQASVDIDCYAPMCATKELAQNVKDFLSYSGDFSIVESPAFVAEDLPKQWSYENVGRIPSREVCARVIFLYPSEEEALLAQRKIYDHLVNYQHNHKDGIISWFLSSTTRSSFEDIEDSDEVY